MSNIVCISYWLAAYLDAVTREVLSFLTGAPKFGQRKISSSWKNVSTLLESLLPLLSFSLQPLLVKATYIRFRPVIKHQSRPQHQPEYKQRWLEPIGLLERAVPTFLSSTTSTSLMLKRRSSKMSSEPLWRPSSSTSTESKPTQIKSTTPKLLRRRVYRSKSAGGAGSPSALFVIWIGQSMLEYLHRLWHSLTLSASTWVNKISLQVNIQHLKDLLKEAIESFPGISFATKDVAIDSPYRVLYHHYGEIQAASKKLTDDTEASQHAGLLLGFIEEKFKDTISESKNLREQGFMA